MCGGMLWKRGGSKYTKRFPWQALHYVVFVVVEVPTMNYDHLQFRVSFFCMQDKDTKVFFWKAKAAYIQTRLSLAGRRTIKKEGTCFKKYELISFFQKCVSKIVWNNYVTEENFATLLPREMFHEELYIVPQKMKLLYSLSEV